MSPDRNPDDFTGSRQGGALVAGDSNQLYGTLAIFMVPPVAFVLPLYMAFSHLGMLNTSGALVIVYCTMLLPFTTWLLKNNFDLLPIEIEQAAMVDGAGQLMILWDIALPLIKPAIGAATLFALLMAWDEFFYALIYTSDLRAKTLPGLVLFQRTYRESEPSAKKNPGSVVEAMSRVMRTLSGRIIADVHAALE